MTTADAIFFAMIAMLAINIFISRLPQWEQRLKLFWFIQLLNLALGTIMLAMGVPDFPWVVNWMIGFLFFYHIVENNRRLQQIRRKQRREQWENSNNSPEESPEVTE